eukprot:COSAG02_NODE_34_length_49821_cov_105.420438_17_plen_102_part_00
MKTDHKLLFTLQHRVVTLAMILQGLYMFSSVARSHSYREDGDNHNELQEFMAKKVTVHGDQASPRGLARSPCTVTSGGRSQGGDCQPSSCSFLAGWPVDCI